MARHNIKIIFAAWLLLPANFSGAQNLVANNGFETYSSLPAGPGEWWKVTGWNNVNNMAVFSWPYASPDFLSTSGSGSAHLPNSVFANVNPYAGNSIMGFIAYYNPGAPDFREYISRSLSAPMTAGQTYTVSFRLTNGSSNQYSGSGCNHVGVHFSLSPLTQSQHEPINVIPQCEITTVWWSTSWQLVSFNFTATAAFQYITIGNFYNDANTTHTVFNSSSTSSFGAYYFIDEVVVTPAALLPVELISFEGKNSNNINHLQWATASEVNNDYFDVERSADGKSFESIGTVDGHGNSSQLLNYEFDDVSPLSGINYYRLKQVDYDSKFEYSQIIAVMNKQAGANCFVYAGETPGNFVLSCRQTENAYAQILDVDGKLLKGMTISNSSGNKIDLNDLQNGLYVLRVIDGENVQNFKLVKN